MKTSPLSYKVPFEKLTGLFTTNSESFSVLEPSIGEGLLQIFKLAKGLQVGFWDCSFNHGIEMYSEARKGVDNTYFTLAFFLNTEGFQFGNKDTPLKESRIWDTLFISANSNCKMYISPKIKGQCLSINFSKKWLCENVFDGNDAFENLKEKIFKRECFSLFESMNASEKKLLEDLLDVSWKKSFGSFYIKSSVFKIISDFFHKIKERETLSTTKSYLDTAITEVEKYLSNNLTGTMPNLKDIACTFSINEATLKRHFKKRYGVNMSTYFIRRKMEYARSLINERNMNLTETANTLGYRNVNQFVALFEKTTGIDICMIPEV